MACDKSVAKQAKDTARVYSPASAAGLLVI